VDHDQAKPALVPRPRGHRTGGADRDLPHRLRQRLGNQTGPTKLAKDDVVGIAVSAADALNHENGFASGDIL
jgi:hypothetical protein